MILAILVSFKNGQKSPWTAHLDFWQIIFFINYNNIGLTLNTNQLVQKQLQGSFLALKFKFEK